MYNAINPHINSHKLMERPLLIYLLQALCVKAYKICQCRYAELDTVSQPLRLAHVLSISTVTKSMRMLDTDSQLSAQQNASGCRTQHHPPQPGHCTPPGIPPLPGRDRDGHSLRCTLSIDLLAPKEINYVHFSLTRQRVVWSQHSSSIFSQLPSAGCCVRVSTSISYLLWSSVLFQRNGGSLYSLVGVSPDCCFPQQLL